MLSENWVGSRRGCQAGLRVPVPLCYEDGTLGSLGPLVHLWIWGQESTTGFLHFRESPSAWKNVTSQVRQISFLNVCPCTLWPGLSRGLTILFTKESVPLADESLRWILSDRWMAEGVRLKPARPRIELVSPAVEAWSPNHWTAREVPTVPRF